MITNALPASGFTAPVIHRLSAVDAESAITGLRAANAARQADPTATTGIYSGDAAKPFSGFCFIDQWALDNIGLHFETIPSLAVETLLLGDIVLWPSINGDAEGSGSLDATDQWLLDQSANGPDGFKDWLRGDFNGDGVSDAADQAIFNALTA